MADQIALFIDFENIARWADEQFLDFELTPLMEFLQSRGPVVTKRAYGDWARFAHYRDDLMENAIDLIQMYSVRAGKNRADIRLAMDALEIAITRSNIQTLVIVSGDSDFGALVSKLREYGKYTLGIGPRSITHTLLVKSCDEFVYLETLLGETPVTGEQAATDLEASRNLLLKALQAHGKRGEVPVPAAKVKQTMLSMDPTFNEANFGYSQFRSWLEDNAGFLKLYVKDLQLYVAPQDFIAPVESELSEYIPIAESDFRPTAEPLSLAYQYRQVFNRLKMTSADFGTRRDVLRDIYRELSEQPGRYTTDDLLDELQTRYDAQGLNRSKTTLRYIWQMGFRQRGFDYHGAQPSVHALVWLNSGIDSEASFVRRAESGFVYAVIHAGLEIDEAELASLLLNDRDQTDYIHSLLEDLLARGIITREEGRYRLPGHSAIPFHDEPALQPVRRDIENLQVPDVVVHGGNEKAQSLARRAMIQRSQDFAASARSYLMASRLQWDAIENDEEGATLEDLRWYMASYASVRAGELSQVQRDYSGSRPYYLAFFSLVQEEDPLWSRMRGLINPMLSYYWANIARELNINVTDWNLSSASPAQTAVLAANHPDPELRRRWTYHTRELATVNPGILRRVAEQIRHNYGERPEYTRVAEQIVGFLND